MRKTPSLQIELYQKIFAVNDEGKQEMKWNPLGPACANVYQSDPHPSGQTYHAVVPEDERFFVTDKIVWKGKDHFMMHSPHRLEGKRLKLKLLSWKKK